MAGACELKQRGTQVVGVLCLSVFGSARDVGHRDTLPHALASLLQLTVEPTREEVQGRDYDPGAHHNGPRASSVSYVGPGIFDEAGYWDGTPPATPRPAHRHLTPTPVGGLSGNAKRSNGAMRPHPVVFVSTGCDGFNCGLWVRFFGFSVRFVGDSNRNGSLSDV